MEVYANDYNGKTYLHVREHYIGDDEEWHPSKKGVTLIEQDQITDLITALQKAAKAF